MPPVVDPASDSSAEQPDLALAEDLATASDLARPPPLVLRLTTSSTAVAPVRMNITQWNWAHQMAVDSSGSLHVAWTQLGAASIEYPGDLPDPANTAQLPDGQIFYKRSIDGGQTWSAETALTMRKPGIDSANIAVSGSAVYAIWREDDNGRLRVFFRRSLDGGLNWDSALPISDNPTGIGASPPSLATSQSPLDSSVYVVWADGRPQTVSGQPDSTKEIFLRSSDDRGGTWQGRMVSSLDAFSSWTPSIAVAGDVVHVGWTDERDNLGDCTTTATPCREEEYYRRSSDKGVTWGSEVRLTSDPVGAAKESWAPSLAAWANVVHFAYLDKRTGSFQIYYRRSLDGGMTWQPEALLSASIPFTNSARPTIAAQANRVHIAWFGFDNFDADIFYQGSQDDGATWSSAMNLTSNAPGAARLPSIAASPSGAAHLIWYDTRDSAPAVGQRVEIYYARPGG